MTDKVKAETVKFLRLIRHAQSAANAGSATSSPDSIPLTELGHPQAQIFAEHIPSPPDLIITSAFKRAIQTALPSANRFPDAPLEIWPVEEFTYLSPARFTDTTQADRKPMADAYWQLGDKNKIDGPGAECFEKLISRARAMLERLANSEANNILVFSHGQFIRAVAWYILYGEGAGDPDRMRLFRELDAKEPLPNCASYNLVFTGGAWTVEHQVGADGNECKVHRQVLH